MATRETLGRGRFKRILTAAFLIPAAALATDCRFTLADQSNWAANTGFYMDLENTPAGSSTYCQLPNMIIAVGVADGTKWRFIVNQPAWESNHNYTAKAVVTPAYFELYLDGQLLGQVTGGFSGLPNQDLLVNAVPSWADGLGNYIPSQSSIDAQSSGGATAAATFPVDTRLVPLMLLAPGSISENLPFQYGGSETLTVTAVFRLTAASANLQSYAPYVDAYGQSVYSSFPGQIQNDADLQTAATEEQTALAAWGTPGGYDAWGGVLNAGWQDTATGFFHVVQRNGVWWLISPAGNPCFYIGLDTGPLTTGNNTPASYRTWEFAAVPPQTPPYNSAWGYSDWGNTGIASVSFDTWNMIRKYGSGSWQRQRLRGQRLDHAFFQLGRHQRHVAIEDRGAYRVAGRANGGGAARDGLAAAVSTKAEDGHRGRARDRVPLDGLPGGRVRPPGMRRRHFGRELGRRIGIGHAIRIDLADARPLTAGGRVNRPRVIAERDFDRPKADAVRAIPPKELRRRDLRREDGSILRIIDGDRARAR